MLATTGSRTKQLAHSLALAAAFALTYGSAPRADDAPKVVKSGEEGRIAVLGSLKEGCTPNPHPTVSVAQVASHGVLRIAGATMKTDRFPKCPGIEIPVTVVFYKSEANYIGQDSVV